MFCIKTLLVLLCMTDKWFLFCDDIENKLSNVSKESFINFQLNTKRHRIEQCCNENCPVDYVIYVIAKLYWIS